MSNTVTNYDGGITTTPQQLVFAETVDHIREVLKDRVRYPSPVRAMGSYHSLTPCASSDGTIVNLSRMNRVISIDREKLSFTAQAGMHFIDASKALRSQGLQFLTNIEIGNMTLGSAACCHTKDALDGVEFGQVNSYVTGMKWVTPSGELDEATEDENPDVMRMMRGSYGLCGIVYEVTFRVEPLEAARLTYLPRRIDTLTEEEVDRIVSASEGLVCWTVGRTVVFQNKTRVASPGMFPALHAAARHLTWNHVAAYTGRKIDRFLSGSFRNFAHDQEFALMRTLYRVLHVAGGLRMYDSGKTVDYRHSGQASRYAFTFWAFPRAQWLNTLCEYLDFADAHFKRYGFRCNLPLGSYFIRRDTHSVLSYTYDGDIISIDPIHAATDQSAWERFLREFNEFASSKHGVPLLNQSPFVTRAHVEAAYGARWREFSAWVRANDPSERMLNPFFRDLLSDGRTAAGGR